MKSGSKTRVTIKWILLITIVFQLYSLNFKSGFSLPGNIFNESVAAAVAAATPELPRVLLNTTYTPLSGPAITVNSGGDLQAAINQAQPGTTILLQAGATFTGNFTLPNKTGTGWIIIRSSTPDANLPQPGTRIGPQNASLLPKILTPNTDAAIMTAPGAHNYRLIGLEIGIQSGVALNYGIVKLGDGSGAQNSLSQVPQDIIVDRCYIHGNSTGDVSRGIALNSGRTAVIDSFISECHAVGMDTQAICGWNGPGPFKIVNNYLEGAGENFMLGGADPSISNLVPSDIEFRNNHVYKPLRWKVGEPTYAGIRWSVKNLFELKNAQRIWIDGNIFENNWAESQNGFAVILKSVNQDGSAPWSTTCDVTFTNNIIRHSGSGINLLGTDPSQAGIVMRRVLIRNNLFDDINGPRWGNADGKFLQICEAPDVVVDHNTAIQTGDAITTYGSTSLNFVFTNNILAHGPYGVKGDGKGTGNDTLNTYFPGAVFSKNVLVNGISSNYPAGNFFPSAFSAVGFVDLTGGDYRLSTTSSYRNAGTDGLDIGWLSSGQATPTPTPTATPTPTPALAITNVIASSITASSVTITWTTNQFADSQVEYGTTTGYGQQTVLNPTLLTSHVEIVSGLAANTTY
ncbi:MAG: fibronectin type III domain-containing protein, partial [Acidobacteria bacterium]|nr:fibronectin type III domain-containing protein [Acidobacteriota bacterium]